MLIVHDPPEEGNRRTHKHSPAGYLCWHTADHMYPMLLFALDHHHLDRTTVQSKQCSWYRYAAVCYGVHYIPCLTGYVAFANTAHKLWSSMQQRTKGMTHQAAGSQGTTFQIWWRLMHPANMPTKMRTTLFLLSVSVCLRTLHEQSTLHELNVGSARQKQSERAFLNLPGQQIEGMFVPVRVN